MGTRGTVVTNSTCRSRAPRTFSNGTANRAPADHWHCACAGENVPAPAPAPSATASCTQQAGATQHDAAQHRATAPRWRCTVSRIACRGCISSASAGSTGRPMDRAAGDAHHVAVDGASRARHSFVSLSARSTTPLQSRDATFLLATCFRAQRPTSRRKQTAGSGRRVPQTWRHEGAICRVALAGARALRTSCRLPGERRHEVLRSHCSGRGKRHSGAAAAIGSESTTATGNKVEQLVVASAALDAQASRPDVELQLERSWSMRRVTHGLPTPKPFGAARAPEKVLGQ
jgi:hypothetical protein